MRHSVNSSLSHSARELVCRPFRWRNRLFAALSLLSLLATNASAGTWSQLANDSPEYYSDTMILLTDGSVMVLSGYDYKSWTKLTPDSTGSYVNGTWSYQAPMLGVRRNFGSTLLTDGRLLVLGGEYSGSAYTKNDTNTGTIYNPTTNKWTPMAAYPEPKFGAGPLVLHPYGYVLAGGQTAFTRFYYPPSDYWFTYNGTSLTGDPKLRTDVNTNETWLLLPDNSVLSYDVNASITNSTATAQRFSTSTATWLDSGTPTALLTTAVQKSKLGPGAVLPNGKVIQIGGNETTAIYTPPASSNQPGTWAAGPTLPAGMGADGAPGAMLPDGHFLFLAENYASNSSVALYDYNYLNNTVTDITSSLPSLLQAYLSFVSSSDCRMLVLPDGGLLLSTSYNLWVYKSSGVPLAAWKPTITNVTKSGAGLYQVQGTNVTGISEGATFGSAARMSTNYPIIKLKLGNAVTYARTANWSAGISRPGFNQFSSFNFQSPPGLPAGNYTVSIIANGIESPTGIVTSIKPGNVTAAFASGTLTVTGDAEANNVTMTYKQTKTSGVLTAATVTVTPNDAYTTVNNGTVPVVLNVGTARFNANINMGAGNDNVTLNSFYSATVNLLLGDGNDTASLLYNSIYTLLAVDGGIGTDTVTYTGNSIIKQTTTNVP